MKEGVLEAKILNWKFLCVTAAGHQLICWAWHHCHPRRKNKWLKNEKQIGGYHPGKYQTERKRQFSKSSHVLR